VVRPQDTLYSIAWRHDLDYRDLARWNNIGSDFRISVGQVLLLGAGNAATQAAPRVGKPRPLPAPSASPAPPGVGTAISGVPKWVWPTDRVGAPRPVPGGGILLAGRLGQDVRAASAGRVVYTGSGLRGYGNLIIIKHADSLLSAYAHNREMLVHEGQDVAPGQVIAHMGEGAPQTPVLYFEIRLNGRPVDPLPYFSKIK
jgi:lipoprotein NlpD